MKKNIQNSGLQVMGALGILYLLSLCLTGCSTRDQEMPIDRQALVSRHNVRLRTADTLGALSVGNGEFAFTVDASGLQTFYREYENGIPLGTQAQWGWHTLPSDEHYTRDDVAMSFESCDGTRVPYTVQHTEGRAGMATQFLRSNPHRLHLGLVGLVLIKENGDEVKLGDLTGIDQQLDLWTGGIETTYEVEGMPVRVVVYAHQEQDGIAVSVESPLMRKNRLRISFNFPYGNNCHVCPGYDFSASASHHTDMVALESDHATVRHDLDTARYYTHVAWEGTGLFREVRPHRFELQPEHRDTVKFTVLFDRNQEGTNTNFSDTEESSQKGYHTFWTSGGVIDFSRCTDPRAPELERRVVLSQYLTKIQCAGSMPPQETGLTLNSWYGKFHLEMHWWHAAQFALWGRTSLLEKSMGWYDEVLPKAMATATWQGYAGARWPKMTDPNGDESPSDVGAFILWQQPHPIYLAELIYRNNPTQSNLQKYNALVFRTAEFMASFTRNRDGKFHLCHPLIPAQEIFKATETDDPAFELQYWYFALHTAQQWRLRLGMKEDQTWRQIMENLAPLAVDHQLYLPNATTPDAYTDEQYRRDHPAVLGALGFLPWNERVDTVIMHNTFQNIMDQWQWETTWGWDYPLLAMTAARLHKPGQAIDALMSDTQKNTYLVNGHNYQDKRLRIYLPGNGGLLAAVAMMAAGWDGNHQDNPGFPKNGQWDVRWEGLQKMP